MKKIYLLALALIGMITGLKAQPDINWGEEFKTKGSISIVGKGPEELFTLRFHKKKVFFEPYDFDDLKSSSSVEVDYLDPVRKKLMTHNNQFVVDGNVILLATYLDKKADKNTLYAKSLTKTGEVIKDWEEIISFDAEKRSNSGNYSARVAPDRKTILIFINPPYEKKEKEKFLVYLYDSGLNKKGEKEIVLDYTDKQVSVGNYLVDNLGNVYILGQVTPSSRKERKKAKKEKEDINTHMLITYDLQKDLIENTEFKLENKTILNASIRIGADSLLVVCGFYQDNLKKKSGLSGVYYSKYKIGNTEPLVQTTREFEKKFIAELIGEKKAKKGKEITPNFVIQDLMPHSDGGATLIAEKQYVTQICRTDPKTGYRQCTDYYHTDHLILIGIDKEGNIKWNKQITKYQTSVNAPSSFHSITCYNIDDKIHIIFNNPLKNHYKYLTKQSTKGLKRKQRRSTLAVTAIVTQSGDIEYHELFNSSVSKYSLKTTYIVKINEKTYLGMAYGRKGRIKLLTFHY